MAETRTFLITRNALSTEADTAVFKFVDGFLSQIGTDFGTREGTSAAPRNMNRVVHWNNNLYVLNHGNLWVYVPTSGDWVNDRSLDSFSSTYSQIKSAWTPVTTSGVVTQAAWYAVGGTSYKRVEVAEDGSVSFSSTKTGVNFSTTTAGFIDTVPLKDKVFLVLSPSSISDQKIVRWEPDTDTETNINNGSSEERIKRICAHQGNIYIMKVGFNIGWKIYRLDGTSQTLITTFADSASHSNTPNDERECAMWSDGTYIRVIIPTTDATSRWEMWRIDPSDGSSTELTDSTMNSVLQGLTVVGSASFTEFVDVESNPGGTPRVWIMAGTNSAGNSINIYEFIDDSTLMPFVGDGADIVGYSQVSQQQGNGNFTWSGDNEFNVTCQDPVVSGVVIDFDFTLYGEDTGVSVEFKFDRTGGGFHNNEVTLLSSTIGSLSSNVIAGLTAVSGGTTGTVRWAAAGDGVLPADFPSVVGRGFKP